MKRKIIIFLILLFPVSVGARNILYFNGEKTNDLFMLLSKEGYKIKHFISPDEAVEKAEDGSAVIITAMSYPVVRTQVDNALYEKAKRKNIKLYIEYPEFVPGVEVCQDNYLGKLERVVITSPCFFMGSFHELAILGLSSCHVIPVKKDNLRPIMSYAKVAGYDKADFGLSNTTVYPLLFQEGNILISTTCLTNFKKAGYRPSNAWKIVWESIVGWLTGDTPEFRNWTTDPEPMYAERESLPSSARKISIRKGSDWFFNAKFLIHPSWYPEVVKIAGDGTHPVGDPIPSDWQVGDGSFGVLEGHVSNIHADGTQDIRYMIRNDMQGETAFALAAASAYGNKDGYDKVSRNLLDFLFFTSNARKGLRNERSSFVYALLGWADTAPYLFYNDDHARALLGSIGAVACLNDTTWNKRIVETILANFRLSSREGFIGNRLSENEILNNGWEYYNKRTFISPHPHFESWSWACYLWLYDKTGYKPLLEKARTAIKITMDAYPKLWKWTNSFQEERARMILPLAWLVKVDDTPLHRKWLDFMVSELLKFQQENGAIQEEIGESSMGQAGVTLSNDDYGKYEASLISKNGDPVSDLLYTSNFAFFALNEAAHVTGNPEHKKAVGKLSDFLMRIQVKSDTHKDLDGAWFRGFDYKRWDYWGSNADEEWGVWCTLTGWIQSWIVSTMVLVDKNTSFWNLTQNIGMEKEFEESLWMLRPVK